MNQFLFYYSQKYLKDFFLEMSLVYEIPGPLSLKFIRMFKLDQVFMCKILSKIFGGKHGNKVRQETFLTISSFMYSFLYENNKIFIKIYKLYKVFEWQKILTHYKHYSVKIGSISFFSSSDMQNFHHLLRCHTIGINPVVIFFMCFSFFKINMPS